MFASKRLGKMHEKLPPGITLIQADDFQTWLMDIQVMDSNPIYQGETYRLKFSFSPQYPIEAPEVIFLRDETHPIPWHPHIYSNGIICLDLLDRSGWSPVHNVESIRRQRLPYVTALKVVLSLHMSTPLSIRPDLLFNPTTLTSPLLQRKASVPRFLLAREDSMLDDAATACING
ncbi:UBC-like protein [Stemphylium lycopersici]|uniref:Ubiquitin-conjugating enzyme E2 2 n=1 Tax=Stemphylium lycopersici TaxID=183478 RepID=A0A364NCD6_STELY|nr:ubiquitin-conjugating enzyme e2 w [Stemphylium lycopersici]RAQ99015.1 UBC-like protein [Stemphylium lycopersici]RAR14988.1 UBC-like protein [Stemphylium lycopersici]